MIRIINENPDWIGAIGQRLDAIDVPWHELRIDAGSFSPTDEPPDGVYFNRMSASSATRGHAYSITHTRQLIAWLEGHGRRVVNGARAFELEVSKVRQLSAMRAAGICVPSTLAVVGPAATVVDAAREQAFPLIIKPNCGGKGLGVRLVQSLAQLDHYVHSSDWDASPDGVTLLQEYIRPAEPCITRCELVGGTFVYSIRSDTSGGFELCPADSCAPCSIGGKFTLREGFDDPIIAQLEAFTRRAGLDVCGIEFIEDQRGTKYVYDINGTTNYNALIENAAPRSAGAMLAAFLREQWEQCQGRVPDAARA